MEAGTEHHGCFIMSVSNCAQLLFVESAKAIYKIHICSIECHTEAYSISHRTEMHDISVFFSFSFARKQRNLTRYMDASSRSRGLAHKHVYF